MDQKTKKCITNVIPEEQGTAMNDGEHAHVYKENKRILAALSAVADYLYKDNMVMALTIIESLVNGDVVASQHLDQSQSSRLAIFSTQFNRWCINQELTAGWIALLPSQTSEGYTSVQVGGSKQVCDLIEALHKGQR